LCREALNGHRDVLGDMHPVTVKTISSFGTLLAAKGQYDDAEPFLREALHGCQQKLGENHPETLKNSHHLSELLAIKDRLKEAEADPRIDKFFLPALPPSPSQLKLQASKSSMSLNVMTEFSVTQGSLESLMTQGSLESPLRRRSPQNGLAGSLSSFL